MGGPEAEGVQGEVDMFLNSLWLAVMFILTVNKSMKLNRYQYLFISMI